MQFGEPTQDERRNVVVVAVAPPIEYTAVMPGCSRRMAMVWSRTEVSIPSVSVASTSARLSG